MKKIIEQWIQIFAPEIWSASQLMPGEGIEDGIKRIEDIIRNFVKKVEEYK